MRYELDGDRPETEGDDFWVAPTAVLIGRVRLLAGASVWWGAVLRGDNEPITVGRRSNVQDNCVLHTDPGLPLVIGEDVTVGHLAVLHGCTIGDGALVGIGAVVLNGARVGRNCMIAAKALIPEGREIPDNSLVMGIPGKVVGEVRPEQAERISAGRRAGEGGRYPSSSRRAITCAWISAAPSNTLRMRASHSTRLIGYSSA
jgi:carbonic anhydrase/acetyltransferase-like protein (isoleucine patch superfamily)